MGRFFLLVATIPVSCAREPPTVRGELFVNDQCLRCGSHTIGEQHHFQVAQCRRNQFRSDANLEIPVRRVEC